MRNHNSKKFHHALAIGALAGGALLAQAAFAQTPAPPNFGPAVTQGRQLQLSDFTNPTPLIPADIYRNGNNKVDHRDLATFAWLEFISAVAPYAGGVQRGVPGGPFASSATPGAGPLVWETYQHRTELFPCNIGIDPATKKPAPVPFPPQPWGAPPKYAYGNAVAFDTPPTACTVVSTPGGFNNLDESSEIGQNFLFFPQKPGNPTPAVDGQVLFEAKVNQIESNWVRANYQSFNAHQNPFYLMTPITLPTGTVEVKAAWRPLSSIPSSQWYRYHIAHVLVYSGNANPPTPTSQPYALVALHIIHKTPNYPAFIFATFEQVDDFVNQAANNTQTGLYYVPTYTSINYATPSTTTFPPTGQTVSNPTITFRNGQKFDPSNPMATPNNTPTQLPMGSVTKLQGVKLLPNNMVAVPVAPGVPTVSEVRITNELARQLMTEIPGFGKNFVWQYYQLVGVQAVPTNDETSEDFYLANIVVESSRPGIQLFRGFPSINSSLLLTNNRNQVNTLDHAATPPGMTAGGGCQGCHGVAQTQEGSDFSFLFDGTVGYGFTPDAVGLPGSPAALARHLAKRKYLYLK